MVNKFLKIACLDTSKIKLSHFRGWFFLIFVSFIFFFGKNCLATDYNSIEVNDANTFLPGYNFNASGLYWGSSFTATADNVSGFSVRAIRFEPANDCGLLTFSLYQGTSTATELASTSYSSSIFPSDSDFQDLPQVQMEANRQWVSVLFNDPVDVEIGGIYNWQFYSGACDNLNFSLDTWADKYPGGEVQSEDAIRPSYPNGWDTNFKIFSDDSYTSTTSEITSTPFYELGGYAIPQTINCFNTEDYCDMVFGYDLGVFSRSIASTSPNMPYYPRFKWWWPNLLADEPIVSSTIRTFIDYGFTDRYLTFTFPRATSTTDYILEIYDPLNAIIGSSASFVVRANLVGTSTPGITLATCLGDCDTGILGEVFCGLKKFTCWAFTPSENSMLYVKQSAEKLTDKFPFNIVFDITGALNSGLTLTSDDRSTGFSIPFIRATTTGSEYYMLEVINASSTENVIGKDNANLFRNSIIWIAYILSALGILTILLKRK